MKCTHSARSEPSIELAGMAVAGRTNELVSCTRALQAHSTDSLAGVLSPSQATDANGRILLRRKSLASGAS